MVNVDALEAAVASETTQLMSFVAFVELLKEQLASELAGDPAAQAKVDAALATILDNRQKMADAMAANVTP